MKHIAIGLLLLFGIVYSQEMPTKITEGQQYLADAQLAMYKFFTSEDKQVMVVYNKLALFKELIKQDAKIKNKKALLEIIELDKDIVTSLRKGLDTSWIRKTVQSKVNRKLKEKAKETETTSSSKSSSKSKSKSKSNNRNDNWLYESGKQINPNWKHYDEYERVYKYVKEKTGVYLSVPLSAKARFYKDPSGLVYLETTVTNRSSTDYVVFCKVKMKYKRCRHGGGWYCICKRVKLIAPRSSKTNRYRIGWWDNKLSPFNYTSLKVLGFLEVVWLKKKR